MGGVDTVNDEFEVGINQRFETKWHRAELVGRFVMVAFVVSAAIPPANGATVNDAGIRLNFQEQPNQKDALVRLIMHQLRVTGQDVTAAARQRGLMRLDQVRYAVAERDGKISIVQTEA